MQCCAVLRSAVWCALPLHRAVAGGCAGLVTYRGYWTRVLLTLLRDYKGTISVADMSQVGAARYYAVLRGTTRYYAAT